MHSFTGNIKRIGFACKWAELDKHGKISNVDAFNTGTTTYAWAKRNSKSLVEEKLVDMAKTNIMNTHALIKKVASLPEQLRMLRITSDMLGLYTLPEYVDFWKSSDMQRQLEHWFTPLGDTARKHNVRLSFHPDQYVVLASDRPDVVDKSIAEFEYHADMARFMGYGKMFQDMKINVHISGKAGPQGIRNAYERLSSEARNCLTIENEEVSYGLDDCLSISDLVPIVLDIHHHNIYSGEYIEVNDDRIKRVIDSWRGIRPTIHYSMSREDYLVGHSVDQRPDLATLLASGYKRAKLRAHSDFMWNKSLNQWALTHNDWADVIVEAKGKQLASFALAELANSR